jgi:hypothetical protein
VNDSPPFRPHQTLAEMVIRLGPTADIIAIDDDDDCPMVQITWGSITVLLMPNSASESNPIALCDVSVARDLADAAAAYRDAMERLWHHQNPDDDRGRP